MKVEFINDSDWQGKSYKAGTTANVPDNEARELILYGTAKPAKGITSAVSQKAVEAVEAQTDPQK